MSAGAPRFELVPCDGLGLDVLHAATLAAFADYLVGPFQIAPAQFPAFLARQGVDLARSRAAIRDGAVAAFGFACPRPEVGRWRLGVMGALPVARGTGAAPALLDDFVARARAEAMPTVELECFAQNERALRLYRSRGFEEVSALNGWKADPAGPAAPAATGEVTPVDRETAFAWLADADRHVDWLPFPNGARSLAGQVRPLTFWRSGQALLVFSVVDGTPAAVHSLVDLAPSQAGALALACALREAHPEATVPPVLRDELGGQALRRAGFAPHGMSQVLMARPV